MLALEQFDDEDQTALPAAIMTRRVVAPRAEVQGVETPADAIAVSLDRTGRVDLPLVAELLGMPEPEARTALVVMVFADPESGELVHAPAYLSGDVRAKLQVARTHAAEDPSFQANVAALAEVLPPDLGVEDITARLGAVWISEQVHEEFLRELLHSEDVRVENLLPGMWEVRGGRQGILATSEWGTARRPAPDIAQALMEQRTLLVYDEYEDADGKKRHVLNPVETTAAQEKADALQERFGEWVWEDPARAKQLVDEYNRRFNSIVLRDYTGAGEYLSLPGLAASFTPREHQRAAVARMIAEPVAGLFHEVGAGKTAEMIMGAMEMRRMGLITKPVVVVPNHMLEQFGREWLQIYPRARILAASSQDLTADKRRLFVARVAANEWDAVILTQGAFGCRRGGRRARHRLAGAHRARRRDRGVRAGPAVRIRVHLGRRLSRHGASQPGGSAAVRVRDLPAADVHIERLRADPGDARLAAAGGGMEPDVLASRRMPPVVRQPEPGGRRARLAGPAPRTGRDLLVARDARGVRPARRPPLQEQGPVTSRTAGA